MSARWNIDSPNTEYYDHTSPELPSIIREVTATQEIAIDTETTGLTIWRDVPLYWSLAWGNRRMTLNVSALSYFAEAFADPNKRWIMANAKYDTHILANVGVNIAGSLVDTQVQHALLYEDRSHRLKDMHMHLFGSRWTDFEDTFGKIGKKQSAEEVIRKAEAQNFSLLVEYAANDAWGTLKCYNELKSQLEAAYTHSLFREKPPYITTLWDLFNKVEVPYTKVLWKNERNGILVDQEYLAEIQPKAEEEIARLHREICKEAGRVINPNSPKDLREYFFDKLRLNPLKMTSGGKTGVRQPSVDSKFLETYADTVPMAQLLLDHRKQSKLYGTYIIGIGSLLDPYGRIHTRYNQDVARTGRLSSSEPNLQNIPNPEKDKWKLRGAFIAPDECKLYTADYEQLEMRLLAAASLEPGMVEVIRRGWDIHMGNASMIFGIPYDEIKQAKTIDKKVDAGELPESARTARVVECLMARAAAKNIGFGLVYGMGPDKLANALGCSRAEAEAKIARFEEAYPAAKRFKEEAVAETEQTGYAFTILGRRRNVPQILSPRHDERMQGERIAVNTQIQGSAADVVKMAQIMLDRADLERRYNCFSLMQVHDELTHQAPAECEKELCEEIVDWMERPFSDDLWVPMPDGSRVTVPLGVDIGTGRSWLEAK